MSKAENRTCRALFNPWRGRLLASGAAVILAVLPNVALAADAPIAPLAALKDRIDAALHIVSGVDQKGELATAEALKHDADLSPTLDPLSRARVERVYVSALNTTSRSADALAAGARGIALLSAANLDASDEMAALLSEMAVSEERQQDLEKAMEFARRAEAILIGLHGKDAPELFTVQCEIGRIQMLGGRLAEAISHYSIGLSHGEVAPEQRINHIINTLSLAILYSRHGDDDQVLFHGRRAFDEAKKYLPEGHRGWGVIYTNLANWLSNSGRLDEADTVIQRSIAYNREHFGATSFDTGASLRTLGAIRWRQGRYEEAERLFAEAVVGLRDPKYAMQNPFLEADAYRGMARVALALENPDAAATAVRSGLESLARNHDRTGFDANLLVTLASANLLQGRLPDALLAVDKALVQFRKSQAPYSAERIDAELLRALILSRLNRKAEAWRETQATLAIMAARLDDPHTGEKERYSYARDYRFGFARAADIAVAAGDMAQAFRCAQMSAYSEIAGSSLALAARVAGRDVAAARHIRTMQDMQVAQYHLERERNFALGRDDRAVTALDARLVETGLALDKEIAAVRQASPAYDRLARFQPIGIESARASLGAGEALLMPVQSDDRLTVLVLTDAGLSAYGSALPMARAAKALSALRDGAETGTPLDTAAAWTLGKALFPAGALRQMHRVQEISVVGSGPLMTLPLAMLLIAPPLHADARRQPFALRRFAFSVRPLVGENGAHKPAGPLAFLGIGAPRLGPARPSDTGSAARGLTSSLTLLRGGMGDVAGLRQLPSLPGAAGELAEIAKALPTNGSVLLTGDAATEQALREQPLTQFGVLAFATHGLISGELASLHEPALVLTPPDESTGSSENDGLLTASEIAGLKLDADWVILSACNTGSGLDNGAGGYSGLARGFMQAGGRNLLVSLWPVRDDVAARISVATVNGHALGLSRPQALRRAMLDVIADRKVQNGGDPAVWAPFSLVMQ